MTRFDRNRLLSGTTLWLLLAVVSVVVMFAGTAIQLGTGGLDAGGIVNGIGAVIVAVGVVVGVVAFAGIVWRFATSFGI